MLVMVSTLANVKSGQMCQKSALSCVGCAKVVAVVEIMVEAAVRESLVEIAHI